MRKLALLLAAVVALPLGATPALAGQPVTLRYDTTDADGVVTLGELFEGAGAAGSTPIARRAGPKLVLDAVQVQAAARRAGLDWPNTDRLRFVVIREGEELAASARTAGAQRANRDVLTYARTLAAGDILEPSDLIWAKAASAPADAPSDADAVIGMAARRPVREGQAVSRRDVAAPIVVKTGDLVTVTYESEGVSLALQAKAVTAGGVGAAISVQNMSSQKIVQAVVVGPGQALVGPQAQAMQAGAARYASR